MFSVHGWTLRGDMGVRTHHGKSHVAIDFLKNSGTDPLWEAIGPLWSNCFSRKVRTALCEIRCWQKKTLSEPPGELFWISAWCPPRLAVVLLRRKGERSCLVVYLISWVCLWLSWSNARKSIFCKITVLYNLFLDPVYFYSLKWHTKGKALSRWPITWSA